MDDRTALLARVPLSRELSEEERQRVARLAETVEVGAGTELTHEGRNAAARPGADILREMARGGLAGLVVGLVVGGIGGRLLMRLAALVEPDAAGLRTENGNVIGTITFDGTLALLVFGGLLAGAIIGSLWVVIRPWLPQRPLLRALVAMPICVAMGTTILIQDTNPDFVILSRNLAVIGALVGLVALVGPSMVLAESALDRLLPVVQRRGPAAGRVRGHRCVRRVPRPCPRGPAVPPWPARHRRDGVRRRRHREHRPLGPSGSRRVRRAVACARRSRCPRHRHRRRSGGRDPRDPGGREPALRGRRKR